MPKPVKKAAKKRPSSDPVTRAKQLMDEQMAKSETGTKPWSEDPAAPADFQTQYREHMKALGSKGGKIGGAKRREMPEAKRKAIAKKAAVARWAKKRPVQS